MRTIFRGWQGHFCCECEWHLNTLLIFSNNKRFIVSTIGELFLQYSTIKDVQSLDTSGSLYETMVFESDYTEHDVPGEALGQFTRHYRIEEAAQAGHYEAIEELRICEQ